MASRSLEMASSIIMYEFHTVLLHLLVDASL